MPAGIEDIWAVFPREAEIVKEEDLESGKEDISELNGNVEEQLWLDPESSRPIKKPRYHTWDSFLVPNGNDPVNPYLTEAGSHVFDAALELHQNDIYSPNEAGTVIRSDIFIPCLLQLGLGRSSLLFRYNRPKNMFVPVKDGMRLSGFSVGTVASVVKMFAQCGKNMKALQRFSERVYKEVAPTATRIALAECTTTVISALQTRLSIPASSVQSIVHLESLFREPALILQTFYRIILEVKCLKDDSKLLSKLFELTQKLQFSGGSGWLRPILVELLRRVSRVWLELVEQWIGLRGNIGTGLSDWENRKGFFVKVQTDVEYDDRGEEVEEVRYVFDSSKVPGVLTPEDAETVFECGRSLRYLYKFHPGHPLSRPGGYGMEMPCLDWKFSWEDLKGIHTQARAYEECLRKVITQYTVSGGVLRPKILSKPSTASQPENRPSNFDPFGKSDEEISEMLSASMAAMSLPLPSLDIAEEVNPLRHVTLHITRTSNSTTANNTTTNTKNEVNKNNDYLTTFAPPLSITPLLSFTPLLTAQSRLINSACLRLFFKEHHLRHHFQNLHRFILLGDAIFTSCMANALLSDEVETTERREGELRSGGRGTGRMGLGLEGRTKTSWPPASSEVRLALNGVLQEAYFKDSEDKGTRANMELPGGLSFAIRSLEPEEYESVMDPHSISALDFLKMNYKPPAPIDAVISPESLNRYDMLFKYLLRIVRMKFVVDQLWRDATSRESFARRNNIDRAKEERTCMKFRIYAGWFVRGLLGYVWEVGVGGRWRAWEKRLEAIEKAIDGESPTHSTSTRTDIDSENDTLMSGVGDNSPSNPKVGSVDTPGPTPLSLSPAHLAHLHNRLLSAIHFAVFLHPRQAPILNLLNEIFSLILRFSQYSHRRSRYPNTHPEHPRNSPVAGFTDEREVEETYVLFRRRCLGSWSVGWKGGEGGRDFEFL
ncbi:Spc98 family-domain-containing protein [Kalaharituber pfeilii]|nr:Spc98 family-domain-containing protein [Kalaharituber pfeilii]